MPINLYQFIADHDHRDRFAGNADLVIVDNGTLVKNTVFRNQDISDFDFRFKIQNSPLVDADMLTVEGNAYRLIVMSNKMLDVLNELNGRNLNCSAAFIAGLGRNQFSVVQAPVLDIFDWEKSEYDTEDFSQSRNGPKFVSQVEQFVFTVPDEQLPVIFRVQSVIGPVLMREDVRELLRQRGIRGVAYKKPGKFSRTNQFVTDLPVGMRHGSSK
ncbi:hypothetical protein [Deinococcus sp. UYEF24]